MAPSTWTSDTTVAGYFLPRAVAVCAVPGIHGGLHDSRATTSSTARQAAESTPRIHASSQFAMTGSSIIRACVEFTAAGCVPAPNPAACTGQCFGGRSCRRTFSDADGRRGPKFACVLAANTARPTVSSERRGAVPASCGDRQGTHDSLRHGYRPWSSRNVSI